MHVFVYGSLRKGMHNYERYGLDNCEYLGNATVDNLQLYDFGEFPAAIADTEATDLAGEIYKINKRRLAELDILENYPHGYDRIQLDFGAMRPWIYFMIGRVGKGVPKIEGNDWCKYVLEEKRYNLLPLYL